MFLNRIFLPFALQVLLLDATVHGSAVEGGNSPGFTTTPGCEDDCSTALDPKGGSIPTGSCDTSTYSDCRCVYEDPFCASECDTSMSVDGEGEWQTMCGGGEPPPGVGDGFVTTPGCEEKCRDADPLGECDYFILEGCDCVYSDKYCSSECSTAGNWMTMCASGGLPGTPSPSASPTLSPTKILTTMPTDAPTKKPTTTPTKTPTAFPTASPSSSPTASPSSSPTASPTSCKDKCSNVDFGEGSFPMGKCESSAFAGCECVYSDKTCSSICDPKAEEWMTACDAVGGGGTPSSDMTGTPTTKPTSAPTTKPTPTPTSAPISDPTSAPSSTPTAASGAFSYNRKGVGLLVLEITAVAVTTAWHLA